ncbi:MAG: type IV pilus assembly protein PilM [bacterium]|nr:type IV pilus assembly protein PilM [bacterium]
MLDALTIHPAAFGLDVSDLSLMIAYLKRQGKGFRLHSFGEFPIAPGILERGEVKQEDALVKIIRQSVASFGKELPTRQVIASLPEEQAFLQVIQLPRMQKGELEQAVRFEAENYIPHSIEKVYLDSQVVAPLMSSLDHSDVLLAALPKTMVDPYLSVLEKAGLVPRALEIESLSISRALILKEVTLKPVLIMDFGATRTSFVVFSGHSLRFTASIPVSSHQLTEAIARTLKVPVPEAEDMKIAFGLERQDDKTGQRVFQALIPSLSDLVEQLKRHIAYYESHATHQHLDAKANRISRVILSGGGANLRGLPAFLAGELEREVLLGNPWTNILVTSLKELPPVPFSESLKYAAALGLALRGQNDDD